MEVRRETKADRPAAASGRPTGLVVQPRQLVLAGRRNDSDWLGGRRKPVVVPGVAIEQGSHELAGGASRLGPLRGRRLRILAVDLGTVGAEGISRYVGRRHERIIR